MKHLSFLLGTALVGLMCLSSCTKTAQDPSQIVEYYPVQLEKNGNWGFISADGTVTMEDEFKKVPTCVAGGLFSVEEGKGYTVYKYGSKPQVVEGLEGLKDVGYLNNGLLCIVRPKERITFVDAEGKTKLTLDPYNGKEIVRASVSVDDGLIAVVTEDHVIGFVNTKGEMVIKPKYTNVTFFSEGYACVQRGEGEDARTYIINTKGEEVCKIKADLNISGNPFKHGVVVAYVSNDDGNDRYGFLNTKGEFTKAPSKVCRITDYNSNLYVYANEDGEYGVMGRDGEELVRARYDYLEILDDNTFLARKGEKYSIIDSKGEKLDVDLSNYDSVSKLDGKGFDLAAKDGSVYVLLDMRGKQKGKTDFVDYGIKVMQDRVVESDYINVNGIVDNVMAEIDADAFCGYKLGTPAYKVLNNAEDYTYSMYFTPDKDLPSGLKYRLEASVKANEPIATSDWDYWSYRTVYEFNKSSLIDGGTLYVYCDTYIWTDLKPALVKAFEAKGFKVDESEKNFVRLVGKVANIEISSEGDNVRIFMYGTAESAPAVPVDYDSFEVVDSITADDEVAEGVPE